MSQYEAFLKELEGPFEEFVKSDAVNEYLQTIGPMVKSVVMQDGVPHEFLVVSGYEGERGNWGTAYDNKIRFGKRTISVEGLENPMVITPNFFFGLNERDEEVEYRMGLKKQSGNIKLFPFILKKQFRNPPKDPGHT